MIGPFIKLSSFLFLFFGSCLTYSMYKVRAAIDIGMGGPKLQVALVDTKINKIKEVLYSQQYPINFYDELSSCKKLCGHTMNNALIALKEAIACAQEYGACEITIIGASVFRNAINGQDFSCYLSGHLGFPVHLIDQKLEGQLAFYAAVALTDYDKQNLVVWDMGGGSMQFLGMNDHSSFCMYGAPEGSGFFRDFIIEQIQGKNLMICKSPNPISLEHMAIAKNHARNLAHKVNDTVKNKLANVNTKVVGVGNVFAKGILKLMAGASICTLEELNKKAYQMIEKEDADFAESNFPSVEVSNLLLTIGFMQELGINTIHIVDVNNATGALTSPLFWHE